MGNLLQRSKLILRRNAPTILSSIGGVGVVATAVLAVKATPKALQCIEQVKEEKGEELTKLDIVKAAGPVYIPSILVGAGTIVCIFGANMLNKRQQAALTSAYALLDSSYKEYKAKIKELYGEEVHDKIVAEVAKDKYKDSDVTAEEGKQLFYDDFSGRYFESTLEKVLEAKYQLNRDIVMREYAYLNEFYALLDIPPIDSGYELGWSPGSNLDYYWQEWVDFNFKKVVMGDGLECTIITMMGEPVPDFADYS